MAEKLDFVQRIKNKFKNKTPTSEQVIASIEQIVHKGRNLPVNLAFIGFSGVGKTSLINSLRNLDDDDPGAGKVGDCGACTDEILCYEDPDHPSVKFFDLPGCGTKGWEWEPQPHKRQYKGYLEKVKFEQYDAILVLSDCSRLYANAVDIISAAREKKKPYLVVRTKFDICLSTALDKRIRNLAIQKGVKSKQLKPEDKAQLQLTEMDVTALKENVLANTKSELENLYIPEKTYIIKNHDSEQFDFKDLINGILLSVPDIKKATILSQTKYFSKDIIDAQITQLKKEAFYASLACGAAGLSPIPGVDIAADILVMHHEIERYRKNLGLNSEGIELMVKKYRLPDKQPFLEFLENNQLNYKTLITSHGFQGFLKVAIQGVGAYAAVELLEEGLKVAGIVTMGITTLLGMLVGVVGSTATTYYLLKCVAEKFRDPAQKVHQLVSEELVKRAELSVESKYASLNEPS